MKSQPVSGVQAPRGDGVLSVARSIALRAKSGLKAHIEARTESDGPTVQERRQELINFYEMYESFVEVLCDSAQFGANEKLAADYGRHRRAIVSAYGPLRPFLAAFLQPEDQDAFRFEAGRPQDAFEKLFNATSLQEFIQNDDGEMIFRIMKTREALTLYGEHLRQLASRVA